MTNIGGIRQVNGLVVNTTPGPRVLALCREHHPKEMLDMIIAQSNSTTVHGILLQSTLTVRLLPHCKHEALLCKQEDTFDFTEVFSNRLHELSGAQTEKLQVLTGQDQQMIVLRAVVITGPNRKAGILTQQLALLVKMFHGKTDVGTMPGLKMRVVYAQDLVKTKHTVAPYVEVRDPLRLRSCGANIVLAAPADSPYDASLGAGMSTLAGPDAKGPAATVPNVLVEWIEDIPVYRAPVAKRHKREGVVDMKIEFKSDACETTRTPAQLRAIKNMNLAEFTAVHVLGGFTIEANPEIAGQVLRQHQTNVWHSLHTFWCQEAIQNLAGVLALCLDGYGHGKMHVLVKNKHGGCSGRWDMVAVWAAFLLKQFPPKFVSTHCTCASREL